jgi:hypothetical protein
MGERRRGRMWIDGIAAGAAKKALAAASTVLPGDVIRNADCNNRLRGIRRIGRANASRRWDAAGHLFSDGERDIGRSDA